MNALPAISLEQELPELFVEQLVILLEFLLLIEILVDVLSFEAFNSACAVEVNPIGVDFTKLIFVLDGTWMLGLKVVISWSKPTVLFKLLIHYEPLIVLEPSAAY